MKWTILQINTYIILNQDAYMLPLFLLQDIRSCADPQKQAYPLVQDYYVLYTYSVVHRCYMSWNNTNMASDGELKAHSPGESIEALTKEAEALKAKLEEERQKLNDVACKKDNQLYILDPEFTLLWNQETFKYNRGKRFQFCG